jgi:hypothetical protein
MQSEERLSAREVVGQVGAKIEELDAMIAQLQKRKQELVEAMNAMKEERTFGRTPSSLEYQKGVEEEMDVVDARVLKALNSVSWKGFGQGKEGEWAFVTDRQGKLTRELEPAKDFIEGLKAGTPIAAGKHRYKVSQDGKFLNRFEVKRGQT